MNESDQVIWQTEMCAQLAAVLTMIQDQKNMQLFLTDIMTPREIAEISARLEAARMLRAGCKYTDIIAQTKLSSRTVARISEWLREDNGGYSAAFKLINEHHEHMSPTRD